MRCLILKSFVSRSISPTLSLAPLVNGWMVMMMRSMCFMSSLVLEVINVKWSLNIIVFRHCLMVCIVCPRFFGPIVKVGVSVTRYEDTPPRPPHHRLQTKAFLDKFRVVHDSLYHSFHPMYDVVGTQDM